MEVIKPQDTPNPVPGNTRTRYCHFGCGASTTETWVKTAEFLGKQYGQWLSSDWPAGDVCPTCKLKEDARVADVQAQKERARAEEAAQKEREALLKMFGGKKPVEEFTFERFDPSSNAQAFQKAKNFNPLMDNLFFYGSTGIGKTHLAVALAREQVDRGYQTLFYRVPDLMREFRRHLDPDDEERLIRKLVSSAVLVIDDLGVGKATEYVVEKLHEIIDGRQNEYRNGLVLTSNLSLNGIAETFKDRIADRLNGLCELVKLDGASQRKRKP